MPSSALSADRRRLLRRLGGGPGRFARAIEGLDQAELRVPYAPGKWGIQQVIWHLADADQNLFLCRFYRMLNEDVPTVAKADPDGRDRELAHAYRPIHRAFAMWRRARREMVGLLRGLDAAAWGRKARHPEFGEFDLAFLAGKVADHDDNHFAHVQQALQALGRQA